MSVVSLSTLPSTEPVSANLKQRQQALRGISSSFVQLLASTQAEAKVCAFAPVPLKPEYSHGRFTVQLNAQGRPAAMTYHAEDGTRLSTSAFNAEQILQNAQQHGLALSDLRGLGDQLDAVGIGFRPYELYPGTGSDHGVDFEDLIAGGLGTAYDWRKDVNVQLKGPQARSSLAAAQVNASRFGLHRNLDVTTDAGIDPGKFQPLAAANEAPRRLVSFNGAVAAWHHTVEEAERAAALSGAHVRQLTHNLQVFDTNDWLLEQLHRSSPQG